MTRRLRHGAANQVTIWEGLRLTGNTVASAVLDSLFAERHIHVGR